MSSELAGPFTTRLTLSTRLASELAGARGRLRAAAQLGRSAVIIHVGGEIGAFNKDIWRRLIAEAGTAAPAPGSLVVDVNAVGFMGCCAFEVLVDEAQRCRHRRIALRLVSSIPRVTRFVDACGFGGVLPVHLTASAALAAAP
ncbi:anti-sigma factor antagonist [Mycobacterium stomatepiae]|uniref:Anti-sigma factor antagonist n=1 Tax=Mycobacterium stomatepiae TaxID=470076 RepID=A0A7I7Q7U4_9MYCO|nr:anti-sigma factor antagonist [Mycobacterium stomatepiae]MCV7162977.1 anti-sigma factor antagonist [Mycobacterium stomatepiae]BBY22106.1 anti-sigma factor antagonist [Mycobacterium stomatepiae]